MARPRDMPTRLLDPEGVEDAGAVDVPDALAGWEWKASRGPATTLKEEMIEIIATAMAETGFIRVAAARAGCTEDALSSWLARGKQQVKSRKRSIYTRLVAACDAAWAHHASYMLRLGDQTVLDKHMNPRWVTWKLSHMGDSFRVPKEGPSQSRGFGPAFEIQSPQDAALALEEKLAHFLATEEKVASILSEPRPGDEESPGGGEPEPQP